MRLLRRDSTILKALLLAALSFGADAALAEADAAAVEVLGVCMDGAATADEGEACIGLLSDQCMDQPDGQTTIGMTQCAQSETEAWDVLLNSEYKAARAWTKAADEGETAEPQMFAVRADELLAAQRAWIAFRDANCRAAYGIYGSGSMRNIAGSQCKLRMTAKRAIELRMLYNYDR